MTLRDEYEHWARSFSRRVGEGWGVFLDQIRNGIIDDTVWDDVRVAAQATKPGSSSPTWTNIAGNISTWVFADAQSNFVEFSVQLPHGYKEGSDIYPHVHWGADGTNTGDVYWRLDYLWCNVGEAFNGSNDIYIADTASGTANDHQIAPFAAISGTGMEISSMLLCKLTRVGASGSDTLTDGACFYEFDIHIEMDSVGSDEEYVK